MSARALDWRAAGSEVLRRWAFCDIDIVPSATLIVVFNIVVIVLAFPIQDVDQSDSEPNFWEQRRFEEHVGSGRLYGCVWDSYWTVGLVIASVWYIPYYEW